MCGTISRTLKAKTQLSIQIKFYKVMAVPPEANIWAQEG
jgi:hypothetical protein